MEYPQAFVAAQCYAWGHEDASKVTTISKKCGVGSYDFAETFATAYGWFDREFLCHVTNVRDAYKAWQASNGETIWTEESDRKRAERVAELVEQAENVGYSDTDIKRLLREKEV